MGRSLGDKTKAALEREGGLVTKISILDEFDDEGNSVVHGVDISKYKLTKLEVEFVIEYMNNGMNATAAVERVYGLAKPAAKRKAMVLINSGRVFPALQIIIKNSVSSSLSFSPALLMNNIQTWLQFDVRNYYDSSGTAIPLDDISDDMRQLISGVDYTINGRTGLRYVTYRLPDKFKTLQELSSIVKFLQSISSVSQEDESEAKQKRDAIFGKVSNFVPVVEERDAREEG
jgi:hypothetical protein